MRPTTWRGFLRSNGKDASKSKLRLQVEALEDRNLMATGVIRFPLEADTIRSAVAPETISLSQTPYSPTLGYGWTSPIKASARAMPGPRQRNTSLGSDNNFRVDLPNGLYSVTVTGGDPRLRNQLSIWAEGQAIVTGQRAASRRLPNFQVVVNDGQLNLSFANSGKARFNLRPNALKIAPVLLTSAGPNLSAEEGGMLSFTGTTSKTSDVTYSWDFGDGNSASGSLSPEHQYRDNQAYTVTLLVRDPSGAIVKSTSTVDVTNAAPTASVSGPYTATAGQALVLSGSATDPSPADTEAGFTYTWNFGDGSKPVSGLNLTQPNHTYSKPGTYTVRVTATDKDNATSSEVTSLVTVAAVPDPILTASAGGSYISTEGASKSLTATAAGGNGIYSYAWDLDNNGTFETTGKTVNPTFPDNGTYTVRLRVADSAGQSAIALATINVSNVAPTASANGPYKVTAGQPLTFAGSANDPSPVDSAAGFTYTWNFGDYTPQISGKDLSSPAHVFANPGTYRVFVTATDKNGATGPASIATVIVAKPADPTLTASAGGSYQGVEGSSVSLTATAAGGNGTYTYAWDLDNNGSFETVGKTVTATFSDNGTYSTQLRVTDSAGQSAFSTATITVANVTPTASISGPYSVTAGQSLTLAASATDPGTADTTAGFTYTWNFGDGSAPLSGAGLTKPNHTYTSPGTYTVLVTATDKDNATSSAVSATVTVVKPPDPLLIASAGERYQGVEGSSVSVSAMAAGGNGVYSYAWDLDNNGTFETAGKSATPTFPDNGTYTVKVRVTDTAGQSAIGTATITIANVTPTAFVTGPYTATAGQALALSGSATDPGPADTTAGFLYTWNFGDGSAPLSGAGLTNPNHTYTTPGAYTVLVTVTDKDNATSSAISTTVTVIKPPDPILIASAGERYQGLEGSAVSLTAMASGGNGVYTYAWDLDSNGSFETAGKTANPTFPDNGTYTVKLRVTDSAGQTAIATTTIAIANVAPTTFGSGSYSSLPGQTLTLHATATDPSTVDTAAGFLYTWNFGDGSATVSGLGLNSPSHVYTTEGEYTATVTVTDKEGAVSPVILTMVTILSLSPVTGLANLTLTPGWATFGQVLPQGAARGSLQLGNLVTQTDVKTTWPDGSIRYAIVSASVPATGQYSLTEATPNTNTFTQTIPDASVKFTIGGVVYTAALPATNSSDRWLNGPLVTEWRTTVTPVDPSGKPHPLLRVIYDTRSYRDGQDRLDVTVENVLDVAGATNVSYDVDIASEGKRLFSQTNITQHYLTRWRKVFDLGLTESQVTLDFEPYYEAGALPRYMDTVTNSAYSTAGDAFGILREGGLNPYMPSTGGRPEIAPYPDWAAQYLVYQSSSQADYMMANGDLAGSWPIHIRENDGSLISIDKRPGFWLDPRGQGQYSYVPIEDQPRGDLSYDKAGSLTPDLAHVPSLAYIPYLTTGDRYYADELAFWANDALISSYQGSLENGGRGGSLGIVGTEQTRARAWALRNLTDAAAYLPDSNPTKAYFSTKVYNNLTYYDNYAQTNKTPLDTAFAQLDTGSTLTISQWMNNFLAWSLEHANQQGFSGGKLMKSQLVSFQLKMFTSGTDYPREYAGPYRPVVGRILPDGTRQYFATMKEIFEANNQNADGSVTDPNPFVYYGMDARVSLMLAMDLELTGAQDAYDWLTPQVLNELNQTSGWALAQKKPKK